MTQRTSLDDFGIMNATDKSSLGHDYLRHYDRLFDKMRDMPITLMEIGVDRGGSLQTWTQYFPQATIVGVDINPACSRFAEGRCIVEIGSQADPTFLRYIAEKWRPSIVIDDGSHQADHIILTFSTIYPLLRPGGIYVIEDVSMHTREGGLSHLGSAENFPHQLLLKLANAISVPGDDVPVDRATAHMTDSIEFIYGMIVIRKKQSPEEWPIPRRRRLVQEANIAHLWVYFSGYLLRHGGSALEAIECCERALALDPDVPFFHHSLDLCHEAAGNLPESRKAAARAVELAPQFKPFVDRLAALTSRVGEGTVASE
jgi:hypothetical protein